MSDFKKYEELIESAFDWYYQEGIQNTNIGNDESMILFLDTETFKEWYVANEVSKEQQTALHLRDVSQQSEQLVAFLEFMENYGAWQFNDKEDIVDYYLKATDCG